MPEPDALSPDFVRQVRNLLAHLYDYAYLQNHPLAALLDPGRHLDRVTRGQRLRRLLLDCLEALRPQADADAASDAARAHSMLTFRYVDGLPMKEIAAMRALGLRQTYREVERGVEAVARILQDRLREPLASAGQDEARPNLLQTAQAEVARLRPAVRIETLDLGEILHGVLDLLRPLSERTGVAVRLASPQAWPPVRGDRIMLRQALLNLLTYALDSLAHGDLLISASAAATELYVDVAESPTISRTCPVAPPLEAQAQVSLPVSQALLAAQGGRLEVGRQEGRWRARLALPTPGQPTILAIDDNEDLTALLQRYLGGHEVKVIGVRDGEQALRLAEELQPHLITLDVMMPALDGWEILQRLKASPATAHIPVVVCSVLHAKELAASMGASGYIPKPVRQDDLLRALQRWLGPLPPAQ